MEVPIKKSYWIRYGGVPVFLPDYFAKKALELNYMKHKEESQDGELELVQITERDSK